MEDKSCHDDAALTPLRSETDNKIPDPTDNEMDVCGTEGGLTVAATENSLRARLTLVLIFLGVVVEYGMTTCVGVFHVVFLDQFGESSGATSWIGSLNTALAMLGIYACGLLSRRFEARTLSLLGVLFCSVGLLTSAFSTSVLFLYMSYGVVTGFGVGFIYMGLCTCMVQTFQRRLAFASGLATSAIGLSTLVYPPLINFLNDQLGWRGAFIVLSSIILQYAVPICFIEPIVKPKLVASKTENLFQVSLLREVRFALFVSHSVVNSLGVSIVFVHLESFGRTVDGSVWSQWLVPTYGLANCLGRFLFGVLGNHPRVEATKTVLVSNALAGVSVCLLPLGRSDVSLLALTATYGVLAGVNGYGAFAHCERYFSRCYISAAYGYVNLGNAVGFLLGAPLAGLVYDLTRQYSWSMCLGGGFTILGALILLPEACGLRNKHRQPLTTVYDVTITLGDVTESRPVKPDDENVL